MITIIETKDYIEALTPFPNGCAFTAYVDRDDVRIGFGCYCLVNLKQGFKRMLITAINQSDNGRVSIKDFNNQDSYEEVRLAIIEYVDSACKHCGGTILFKKN